jgi:hypothetical protein
VFEVPVTVALNCWVCEELSDVLVGLTVTLTVVAGAVRETVACALSERLLLLVAVTVIVCALVIEAGAV